MAYKTIFSTGEAYISADRTDGYLRIRVGNDYFGDRISLSIPRTEVESFLQELTDIANAPDWTRAKFIRVTPHNPRIDSYTMYRVDDGKWLHENGQHVTDTALAAYHVDITVLA